MSNLTYNPNVNIPYNNNNYNNFNNNINMDFDSGGNFRASNTNYDSAPQLPQMDPRGAPQYNPNMEHMGTIKNMRPPMRQTYNNYYEEDNDMPPPKIIKKKKTKSKYSDYDLDTFQETKSTKFDWLLLVKKLVIYTALFLIMSHVKMDELVCKFVPFLSENQILCMTVKGLILALLIILVQMIL
jgi:hypothetical protein